MFTMATQVSTGEAFFVGLFVIGPMVGVILYLILGSIFGGRRD